MDIYEKMHNGDLYDPMQEELVELQTLKGLEECARLVERLTDEAIDALSGFEEPWFLEELARVLVGRTN